MMNIFFDFKNSLRQLSGSPVFSLMCILIMALGIGLFVEIYSTVRSLAYTDLPVADPDRWTIVVKSKNDVDYGGESVNEFTYNYIKKNSQKLTEFGFSYSSMADIFNGERAKNFRVVTISTSLLRATGVKPFMGRMLVEEDENYSSSAVLIGFDIWKNYLSEDANIIGKRIQFNNQPVTVVGVMPKGYGFPNVAQIWLPFVGSPSVDATNGAWGMFTAKLKPGVSVEDASHEVSSLYAALERDYPQQYQAVSGKVIPFTQQSMVGSLFYIYMLIIAGVTIISLASINIGSLIMARSVERAKYAAIRSALGASQMSLVVHALIESFIICFVGGAMGLIIGAWSLIDFQKLFGSGPNVPYWWLDGVDAHLVLVALAVTIIAWLLTGVYPAWKASSININAELSGGSKGVAANTNNKISAWLLSSQVLLSCTLLIASVAMVLVIDDAIETDLGLNKEGLVIASFSTPNYSYGSASDPDYIANINEFYQQVTRHLQQNTGVANVAMATTLPGTPAEWRPYNLQDRDLASAGQSPVQMVNSVDDKFFDVLSVSLLEGRNFNSLDTASSERVVIVEDRFSNRAWPGESVLGKSIVILPGTPAEEVFTVVGVVPQILQLGPLGEAPKQTTLYFSVRQQLQPSVNLVARVEGNPYSYRSQFEAAMAFADETIPLGDIVTVDDVLASSFAPIEYFANRCLYFSALALLMVSIGIYGVVSRSVDQQKPDIGIRRALGMTDRDVVVYYIKKYSRYLFWGLPVGIIISYFLLKASEQMYTNIMLYYPVVSVVVVALMAVVVVAACYMSVRKFIKLQPVEAIRYE